MSLLRRGLLSSALAAGGGTFLANTSLLNGVDEYYTYPTSVSDGAAILTVATWFRTSSLATDQYVWGEETSTNNIPRVLLIVDTAGKISINMRQTTNGANTAALTTSAQISINTDYHIMALIDTTNNTLKIYVNGSEVTTDNPTPTMSAIYSGAVASSSAIGVYTSATQFFVVGKLSFLDVWLSDQTANASYLYNSGDPICYSSRSVGAKVGESVHLPLANWTGFTSQETTDQVGTITVTPVNTPTYTSGLTVEC